MEAPGFSAQPFRLPDSPAVDAGKTAGRVAPRGRPELSARETREVSVHFEYLDEPDA